ncbi:MAG: sodium:proton antiporter [Rhodospirillales bacterium]|jgi:CPA1 family monovalent cation:H+ antiporter|nr:sodium:proton antiporter [Rhodospirillales bacterium]HIJ43593.1 sodium:proton antiporter [Rhodospirillaceae bacterium]MDP7214572.1 sodium:proton antiporter [Rhodospirillales bacterium]HIJ45445.1 sodium:proton antiporter [Rhodospirillaceae bacterium]HIJ93041.1 sodium:proton antiporter [Rhodospirillaceae bacterium]
MTETSLFNIAAIVITLAALFGYVNHRWMKLQQSIGLVVIALFASFGVIALDALVPSLGFREVIRHTLERIDFHETLMKGMLSFLLFAGALHVDIGGLIERKWAIGSLATAGLLISTFLVGGTIYFVIGRIGLDLPLTYCLVFGALISPTDPVAVLGILKTAKVPEPLEAKIAGESLFNDGVGIVVFTILVAIAAGGPGGDMLTAFDIGKLFVMEAFGGALLGLIGGYLAYSAMKSIDEHNLEVLITLSLVMLTYSIALAVHASGPIAVVVAGLLIGNRGTRLAMSENTRDHIYKFWSLTDEVLNSVLFLMIGFEVLALTITAEIAALTAIVVPVVIAARFVSVAAPLSVLTVLKRTFTKGAIPILTWGGLRGGISVALALSLPDIPAKDIILAMTYGVVIFSIIVQGLTVKTLVRMMAG